MKPRSRRLRKKSGGTTELYQGQGQGQGQGPTSWLAAPPIPDQGTPVVPAPGVPGAPAAAAAAAAAPAAAPAAAAPAAPAAPGLTAKFLSFFSSNKPASGATNEPGIFDNWTSKLTGMFSSEKSSVGGTKKRKRNNKSKCKGKSKK